MWYLPFYHPLRAGLQFLVTSESLVSSPANNGPRRGGTGLCPSSAQAAQAAHPPWPAHLKSGVRLLQVSQRRDQSDAWCTALRTNSFSFTFNNKFITCRRILSFLLWLNCGSLLVWVITCVVMMQWYLIGSESCDLWQAVTLCCSESPAPVGPGVIPAITHEPSMQSEELRSK